MSDCLVTVVVAFSRSVPILGGLGRFIITTIGTGAVINRARDDSTTRYPGTHPQQVNKRN
ncbi:hypothetical protein [Halovivax asiaticus]|uniref:hypothetical protein n=1 Tax=Halovivax asiaticus TaxID=332953 RepID=UPI000677AD36|nr:hypothetical protein [Halovivax asiaticus]